MLCEDRHAIFPCSSRGPSLGSKESKKKRARAASGARWTVEPGSRSIAMEPMAGKMGRWACPRASRGQGRAAGGQKPGEGAENLQKSTLQHGLAPTLAWCAQAPLLLLLPLLFCLLAWLRLSSLLFSVHITSDPKGSRSARASVP